MAEKQIFVEEHRPLLQSLIYLNQCRTIVEIGVANAYTTEWLCMGARTIVTIPDTSEKGKVYGYDIWDTHGLNNQFEHWSSKEECEEYLRSKGIDNFELTKIDSKTQEFRDLIKSRHGGCIDLAFIDGCHSYEGIKNDFDVIYPELSQNGIIVFHDTMRIDGCRRFVAELREELYDGTFDVVTFPYGCLQIGEGANDARTGISVLVKRGYATSGQLITEQCDLEEDFESIYTKERAWYKNELARGNKK